MEWCQLLLVRKLRQKENRAGRRNKKKKKDCTEKKKGAALQTGCQRTTKGMKSWSPSL